MVQNFQKKISFFFCWLLSLTIRQSHREKRPPFYYLNFIIWIDFRRRPQRPIKIEYSNQSISQISQIDDILTTAVFISHTPSVNAIYRPNRTTSFHNSTQMTSKLHQNDTNMTSKWHQNWIRISSKLHKKGIKMASKWHKNDTKMTSKLHQNCIRMTQKWHKSDIKIASELHQNGIKMTLKWR